MNKVILIGRLGRDPELRYTGGGQAVANFSLATDESYKDRNGEKQKKTEWHRIVLWGKSAERVTDFLQKGTLVLIEGRMTTRKYETRGGEKKESFEIHTQGFRLLADGVARDERSSGNNSRQPQQSNISEDSAAPVISDEDIPF